MASCPILIRIRMRDEDEKRQVDDKAEDVDEGCEG